MPIVKILGVKIDNLSKQEILKKIQEFLKENKFHQIVTVNPEFVLEAQKNESFKNVVNSCDLNVSDGVGINMAFWKEGVLLESRIAGADLVWDILEMANSGKLKVFLINNEKGLSNWREVKKSILKKYPFLKIEGMSLNPDIVNVERIRNNKKLLNSSVVFCNFGAPCQELFLRDIRNCDAKVRLAVGVGGSFDFIAGKIKRSPRWMSEIGLEWFWRLIQQPARAKRIFNAVVVFPVKILLVRK